MATSLDIPSFDGLLKNIYSGSTVDDMTKRRAPLLAAMAKFENFGGDAKKIPIVISNPQGRSSKFSNAQANQTNGTYPAFLVTRVSDYQLANINNETIQASMGDEEAFERATTTVINGALINIGRSLAISLYLDGTGVIGQVASVSSNTATLTQAEDSTHFEIGQTLDAGTTTTGALRSGTMVVTAVDRIAGTFTCSGGVVSGLAANDYLFVDGDAQAGGATPLRIRGLAAWLPFGSTAISSSDSFWGVNRYQDRIRLGGVYLDISGGPIEEGLIDLAELIIREGGDPEVCFMSHKQWGNLKKSLGTKVEYENMETESKDGVAISFKAISVTTGAGSVKIVADVNCPTTYCYMLDMNGWELGSLGKAPDILTYLDGMKAWRNPSQDSVEVRAGYYANPWSNAPGHNGVGKMPVL